MPEMPQPVCRDDSPALLNGHNIIDRFVTSAGVKLHLRWRPADVPEGAKPRASLLCLHGFLAHAHWYDPLMACLPADWEVAALSFAGMGQSEWRGSYDREQDWQDVVTVCQALGFQQRPILFGHSFGGAVAIHAMARAGEAFQSLMVCDTSMRFVPAPIGRAWNSQRRYYKTRAEAEGRFRYIPEQPATKPWIKDFIAQHSVREFDEGWSWVFDFARFSGPESNRDFWNQLIEVYEALPQRPLFIRGALSALCSPAWERAFYDRLGADAQLLTIAGAHHHVLLDQPAALAQAIVANAG